MCAAFSWYKFPASDMLGDEGRKVLDAVVKVELVDASLTSMCPTFIDQILREDRYSIFDIFEAVSYFNEAICLKKRPIECVFNKKTK